MAFAAIGMVAMVGMLAIVIDNGMFLVAQRQMQAAADAGSLAAAWYDPICPSGSAGCMGLPGDAPNVAVAVAQANAAQVAPLCGGQVTVDPPQTGSPPPLNRPVGVRVIVVSVHCDAGYTFGRILNLTTKTVGGSAAAAMGDRHVVTPPIPPATPAVCGTELDTFSTGLTMPPCGRLARLIE